MATTKALRANIDAAFIKEYVVAPASEIRQGVPIMLSGSNIVECNSDDDLYLGVSYTAENGSWPATAGKRVGVVMRGSPCCIPVRSTATGLTAGAMCAPAAGGVVNVTVGGGTVITNIVGQVLETVAADGDLAGCNLGAGCVTVTST